MRDRFNYNPELFYYDIESVEIPMRCDYSRVRLVASLLEIYKNQSFRDRILTILEKTFPKNKSTGPKGLNLWQIFVLAQCRLCDNLSYSNLHYVANQDMLIRHILGIRSKDGGERIVWSRQRIYDNLNLLKEETLREINEVIVDFGHEVFKKKRRKPYG